MTEAASYHIKPARFATLDVFRGITIFLMIIVNTPGSGATPFPFLLHAEWHGFTLTDLVFPSFLFAVGNAMSFAMKKLEGLPAHVVLYRIARRSVLIFIVGYLLTWYTTMHWVNGHLAFTPILEVRIMAVLQRIALCYFIAALLVHFFSKRPILYTAMILLLLYWLVLYMFGEPGSQYSITGNVVGKLDRLIIGEQRMYREHGIVFDPEGLLSTVPAVVNVLAGYLAGVFIATRGSTMQCVLKLLSVGLVLVVAGLAWNIFLPFNKKLWTSSYVVLTTGIDLVMLSVLFYCIEILALKRGFQLFAAMGKNPLFIYVLSNLFMFILIFPAGNKNFIEWVNDNAFQQIAPGPVGSLLFALCFTLVLVAIASLMDKKKIYIRL